MTKQVSEGRQGTPVYRSLSGTGPAQGVPPAAPIDNACGTRYSAHGPRYNVREDYAHLPFQPFWTWVTGKGRRIPDAELSPAQRPLAGKWVIAHLLATWVAIGLALWVGYLGLQPGTGLPAAVAATLFCWLVITNRGRSLQATFHYMSHGAAMPNQGAAAWAARIAFTTPFLYTDWRAYIVTHATDHHHVRVLCTDVDPDQLFIQSNGIHPGMAEHTFWRRVWLRPFAPGYIAARLRDALRVSLVQGTPVHRFYCLAFWGLVIGGCAAAGQLFALLWLFAIPAFVLLNHSFWVQLMTEHLWFVGRDPSVSQTAHYGGLTWGRFQGRRPPERGLLAWAGWWARLLVCDIPVRLYVFPQDLPNHDFHHRLPMAPYHRIADIRATHEDRPGRFGPMLEVWGFMATMRVMRDHLCRGDTHPFRFSATRPAGPGEGPDGGCHASSHAGPHDTAQPLAGPAHAA